MSLKAWLGIGIERAKLTRSYLFPSQSTHHGVIRAKRERCDVEIDSSFLTSFGQLLAKESIGSYTSADAESFHATMFDRLHGFANQAVDDSLLKRCGHVASGLGFERVLGKILFSCTDKSISNRCFET